MPRLTNSIPKYRKHRASGQAIVEIAGKTHYLGPHGTKTSKTEYDRLVAEWLAAGRSPSFGTPEAELTVAELLAAFIRYAKGYYGTGNRGTYANMKRAVQPLRRLYSRTSVADFGPQQFKTVRQTLIDADQSRTYINEMMRRMVQVFRWGASEGLIPAAVAQTLSIIPGLRKGRSGVRETDSVKPVDPALVEATLPHLSPIVAAMVKLQSLTGARPGEIVILRPGDIDRTSDVWLAELVEHKTSHYDKSKTVYIGPQGQNVLRPFLLRPADAFCFSPQDSEKKRRAAMHAARRTSLSCGNKPGSNRVRQPKMGAGERYTTQSYARAVRRGCEKAGIDPHWTPSQIRHLVATQVRRDFDLDAAKTVFGAQPSWNNTTLRRKGSATGNRSYSLNRLGYNRRAAELLPSRTAVAGAYESFGTTTAVHQRQQEDSTMDKKRRERARQAAIREIKETGIRIDEDDPDRLVATFVEDGETFHYAPKEAKKTKDGTKDIGPLAKFAHAATLLLYLGVESTLDDQVNSAFNAADPGIPITDIARRRTSILADFSASTGELIHHVENAMTMQVGSQTRKDRSKGGKSGFDREKVVQRVQSLMTSGMNKTQAVKAASEQSDM